MRFFVGWDYKGKRIAMIKWESICKLVKEWCLGIKDIMASNTACLLCYPSENEGY